MVETRQPQPLLALCIPFGLGLRQEVESGFGRGAVGSPEQFAQRGEVFFDFRFELHLPIFFFLVNHGAVENQIIVEAGHIRTQRIIAFNCSSDTKQVDFNGSMLL